MKLLVLLKRLVLESICGFVGIYALTLAADALVESAGVNRTPVGDWVIAALPFAVGIILGTAIAKFSQLRPTLTWIIPALCASWTLNHKGTQTPLEWLYTILGSHCSSDECLGLIFVGYPLSSTLSFSVTILLWKKFIDPRVKAQTSGDAPGPL